MRKSLWIAAIPLTLAITVGCKHGDSGPVDESVSYKGIHLEKTSNAQLTDEQTQIYSRVNAEQTVQFGDISKAFINEHAREFVAREDKAGHVSGSLEDNAKSFAGLITMEVTNRVGNHVVNLGQNFEIIKMQTEKSLEAKQPLLYNIDSNSPFDLMLDNKMQCYSGTVYHQFQWRAGTRQEFASKNPVVIYEFGHILPGYVGLEQGNYHLYGVETTVDGLGLKDYGLTKDLNRAMRVIDADMFALIEIFKGQIANTDDVRSAALKLTAAKYMIPLDTLEALVAAQAKGAISASGVDEAFLNSDFMMFGNTDGVAKGDQKRGSYDSVKVLEFSAPGNQSDFQNLSDVAPAPINEVILVGTGSENGIQGNWINEGLYDMYVNGDCPQASHSTVMALPLRHQINAPVLVITEDNTALFGLAVIKNASQFLSNYGALYADSFEIPKNDKQLPRFTSLSSQGGGIHVTAKNHDEIVLTTAAGENPNLLLGSNVYKRIAVDQLGAMVVRWQEQCLDK